MCLLLLAIDSVPGCPWLLLGNRDEFHARPTAPAQPWVETPDIVGGRDLLAGGSWLALHRKGRFAAVTNVRRAVAGAPLQSRGALVGDFVGGDAPALQYIADVAAARARYGPFNLIVGTPGAAYFVSSIDGVVRRLDAGVHAFSNGSPDDEWPKMRRLRTGFVAALAAFAHDDTAPRVRTAADDAALLDLLLDTEPPEEGSLPDTGIGIEMERRLAPIFIAPLSIRGEAYGTRASTLAYARTDGSMLLLERRFGADGSVEGESRIELPAHAG